MENDLLRQIFRKVLKNNPRKGPDVTMKGFFWGSFLTVLIVLSVSGICFAKDIYIAATQAGNNNGSSCSNAYGVGFFNVSSNWGAGAGQISPGDTVHLCGTFTGAANSTILTAHASGSSGSPITVKWEPGAVLTSPACSVSGCINTNSNTYLVFDGNGTAPSITATNNGTGAAFGGSYANSVSSIGIYASACNNCEFKNLSITNMYVLTSQNDNNAGGSGIVINGSSNVSVHDSSFDWMNGPISDGFGTNDTNVSIYDNTFNQFNHGIEIGNNNANKISNISIYGNHFESMVDWDTGSTNNFYHHDGIIAYQDSLRASSITNMQIYDNLFDGDMGLNVTAWIYVNSGLNGVWIFNNKFFNPSSIASNGRMIAIGDTGDTNIYVYNNFLSCGNASMGIEASANGAISNVSIVNNAMRGCQVFNYLQNLTLGTGVIDYNAYEGMTTSNDSYFKWEGTYISLSALRALSPALETHSITPSSLGVNSTGVPQAGSALIGVGSSLTSLGKVTLDSDYVGNPRPSSGAWDIGACQYPTGLVLAPPSNLRISSP